MKIIIQVKTVTTDGQHCAISYYQGRDLMKMIKEAVRDAKEKTDNGKEWLVKDVKRV